MPAVPLGLNAYRRSDALLPEVVLKNMLLEEDKSGLSPDRTLRVQRPGLTALGEVGPGPIRGLLYVSQTSQRFAVSGTRLYVNASDVGAIGGLGLAPMVNTAFATAIVGGDALYLYDGSLASIAMPDSRAVQDVDQLNGYILILTPTGRFYWLEPGQTTVDALNFATAESLPDKAKAIRRVGDEFVILGDDGGEVWQATGNADAPFQRVSGRSIERGCLSRDSVQRFDNSLVWVTDDLEVVRLGPVPQTISDSGISERLRKRNGDPTAWSFGFDGHKIYCLDIPGQGTWGHDAVTRQWSEWASPGRNRWLPRVGYEAAGVVVAGSSSTAQLWSVDPSATNDAGSTFERVVTGTVPVLGSSPRNDSFSVGVGSSGDCTIRVRWKDGQEGYPDYYDELDARAPLDVVTMYRLGIPDQPYRTFEVSVVDNVRVHIAGAMANEGWK